MTTLQSVLVQTYQDYEIIIVDDGSTDGSAEMVEAFWKEYQHSSGISNQMRLIQKENGGVCSARNVGIKNAQGKFIAFLDADDLWEPSYLEEMAALVDTYPMAAIVGSSYWFLKGDERILADKALPKDYHGLVDNSAWDKAHLYCSSAVCCRKDALKEVGGFDERIAFGEDIDVWWRIMLRYPAAYANVPLATYRFDAENRAMERKIPLEKLYIYYFEKYAEDRKTNDAFRHFIDKECMWWLFPYYVADTKNKDARRILKQIDLHEYKPSFRLRFLFPRLYKIMKQ